jgi:hypothetical protein
MHCTRSSPKRTLRLKGERNSGNDYPTRIAAILDEAAERFQIVLLTCHPKRYRGLPKAESVDLEHATKSRKPRQANTQDSRRLSRSRRRGKKSMK